jgi:hypothetical protein
MDYVGGCGLGPTPCMNCESRPTVMGTHYCSYECLAEWEGLTLLEARDTWNYWIKEDRA